MKISVIIPVFRDWDRLSICIEALSEQTLKRSEFEVIIINNEGNTLPPPGFKFPENYKILQEEKPGSYCARNTGIRHADGKYIAFTDSDCIPNPTWLENAMLHLESGADRVGGMIKLFYSNTNLSPAEMYEKAFAFNQQAYVSIGTAATANMIAKRDVFDKVGFFNEELMSGGDMEWGWRAKDAGHEIKYGKDVIVLHPARQKMAELFVKAKRVSIGKSKINNKLAKQSILKLIFTGFLPSKTSFRALGMPSLTIQEKITAITVAYILKIYSTSVKLSAKIRNSRGQ